MKIVCYFLGHRWERNGVDRTHCSRCGRILPLVPWERSATDQHKTCAAENASGRSACTCETAMLYDPPCAIHERRAPGQDASS